MFFPMVFMAFEAFFFFVELFWMEHLGFGLVFKGLAQAGAPLYFHGYRRGRELGRGASGQARRPRF